MEHKGRMNSLTLFFSLVCVYCMVDHVEASIPEKAQTGQVDVCADILGPNWNMSKHEKSPCSTLVVWVPKKAGYTEFVKINEHNEVDGGFSIAVLCKAIQFLPFNVRPIFKPFINETGGMNGTYVDLLRHIKDQKCQAVAGDVTIRANRTEYVSFTIPYLSAEMYMLVHATHEWNQTLGTFLKPFTTRLWISLLCACIITGIVVALLEYRVGNPKFASPIYKQLIMVMWFPISTFFFHEGKILNKCSKVVLVMWLCMIFIVLQIFTATLSSWLTLDQLRPKLPSHVKIGYQDGSFIKDLISQIYKEAEIVPLNSYEDYKNALANGGVDGIVDHLYYIDLFLSKYPSEYMKVGPIQQEAGIAFALPIGSNLLENLSRAVTNVVESEFMVEMKKKYLGISMKPYKSRSNQDSHPQNQLDVKCFIGLFTFMGIVTIVAVIFSEISIRHGDNKIGIEDVEKRKERAAPFELVQIKILN